MVVKLFRTERAPRGPAISTPKDAEKYVVGFQINPYTMKRFCLREPYNMWLLRHEPAFGRCQIRARLLSWQPVNRRARGKHAKGLPIRFTGKDTLYEA